MSQYIINKAKNLVEKFKTRNPYEIIENFNIELVFDNSFSKLKGFYTVMNRQPYIVINSNLSDEKMKIVAAHELGHHILHRKSVGKKIMQEFELYNMKTRHEYEANSFAAEILISDDEMIQLINDGYDMEQIAATLKTDVNIIGIKLGNMNCPDKKYNIGIEPKSDFLKE